MVIRALVAACCAVVALAVPAQAQDGCTSDLIRKLVTSDNPDPAYPIVERDPDGTIHVYPQNVVPATVHAVNSAIDTAGQTVGHVLAWVDCVD